MTDDLKGKVEGTSTIENVRGGDPKFFDNYVAYDGRTVVAYGKRMDVVVEEARVKGITEPAIEFVTDTNKHYFFNVRVALNL
jgi:hypothetical protein